MGLNEATLTLHVPTQAAGNNDEWYLPIPWEGTWRMTKAKFAPATAVAVDATNFLTATITGNDGAGGSDSSAIASHKTETTGGVAFVLKTTIDLALTQRMDFAEGSQVKVGKVVSGTGQILDGVYVFVFEKIN